MYEVRTEYQVKTSVAKLFDSTKEELPNFEVISDWYNFVLAALPQHLLHICFQGHILIMEP